MHNKRKIAVVDDHAMFRKGLVALINLFPNDIVILDSSNGEEFISALGNGQLPDIVLMDIKMPIMDGYSTTDWLRAHYPMVKVIALSTMDAETAIIKMIKSGAKGYMLKDAEPGELKLAFDEVMAQGYFYNELVTRKVMNSIRDLVDGKGGILSFARLTERETEFLRLACTELTYKEIADRMSVGVRTVDGYRDTLCEKLGLKTRVGLVVYAIKNNIFQI